MLLHKNRQLRRGTALVETAFVITLFVLVLFGVIEFSRFLFMRQVVDNAAREGARFAVVNTASLTLDTDTIAVVNQKMVGVQNGVKSYGVLVYQADASGNKIGTADSTPFGSNIAVQIDCDYSPILPSMLFLGTTIHIRAKVLMNSEAN